MAHAITSEITVTPLSAACGAEIAGIDLRETLSPETFDAITRAWREHIVLLFRGQELDQDQQLAFAGRFGKTGVRARPADDRPEGADYHAGIMLVSNIRKDGKPIGSLPDGEMWFHHDMCYVAEPHKGTFLYAIEIPDTGGNTRFTNMYMAYDALSDGLREKLAGRTVLHVYDYKQTRKADIDGDMSDVHHYTQPIFVTNPQSGRKALYVNQLMTARIDGLARDESDAILDELFDIVERPEHVFEHVWTPGDLVMWDNLCSCHARTDFPAGQRRLLRRCTVEGSGVLRENP